MRLMLPFAISTFGDTYFRNVFHLLFLDFGIIDLKMVMQHSGLMTYMIYVICARIQVASTCNIYATYRTSDYKLKYKLCYFYSLLL